MQKAICKFSKLLIFTNLFFQKNSLLFSFVQEPVLDINLIYVVQMLDINSSLENIISILSELSKEELQWPTYCQTLVNI